MATVHKDLRTAGERLRSSPAAVLGVATLAVAWFVPWVWGIPVLAMAYTDADGRPVPVGRGTLFELGAYGVPAPGHPAFLIPLVLVPLVAVVGGPLILRDLHGHRRPLAAVVLGSALLFVALPLLLVPGNQALGGWLAALGAVLVAGHVVGRRDEALRPNRAEPVPSTTERQR